MRCLYNLIKNSENLIFAGQRFFFFLLMRAIVSSDEFGNPPYPVIDESPFLAFDLIKDSINLVTAD